MNVIIRKGQGVSAVKGGALLAREGEARRIAVPVPQGLPVRTPFVYTLPARAGTGVKPHDQHEVGQ